jgi:hypothetical protein
MRVKSAANGRPTNKSKVKQHTGTNEGLLKENRDAEINISNVFLGLNIYKYFLGRCINTPHYHILNFKYKNKINKYIPF